MFILRIIIDICSTTSKAETDLEFSNTLFMVVPIRACSPGPFSQVHVWAWDPFSELTRKWGQQLLTVFKFPCLVSKCCLYIVASGRKTNSFESPILHPQLYGIFIWVHFSQSELFVDTLLIRFYFCLGHPKLFYNTSSTMKRLVKKEGKKLRETLTTQMFNLSFKYTCTSWIPAA